MTAGAQSELLLEKILPIRLVVFDIDGTLTDGSICLTAEEEMKVFHAHDGAGLKFLMNAGITVALLTNRRSVAVERRAKELGIEHIIQGAGAKGPALEKLQAELGVTRAETAAMGDDLPDLALMRRAGLKLSVPNARPELLAVADWVAQSPAGHGAAREACELILKAKGLWAAVVAGFDC